LAQLNRDTVGGLRALWRTGMVSGVTPGHAGQAQILACEGVPYVANGANDVFAMDMETGRELWKYVGKPDLRAGSPIGRVSRGVALGDGKVFVSQADAKLSALDQRTGAVVWTFYTEQGPGEPYHDTWPRDSEAWTRGGASIWQSPAVDPELGLL